MNKAGDMKFTLRQLTYFIASAETGPEFAETLRQTLAGYAAAGYVYKRPHAVTAS